MALLLAEGELVDLGVDDGADDLAVLVDLVDLGLAELLALGGAEALDVLGERLALLVEALVEAALEGVGQMLGPDGGEGAQTARRLDVANNANNDDRRRLEDRHGLDDLLLVRLGAGAVQLADDVRHASLEAKEPGQVDGLALRAGLANALARGAAAAPDKSDSQEVSA